MKGMRANHDFERLVVDWLGESAGSGAPDYLGETLTRIEGVRQRPAWMSPGRWLPMRAMTLRRFETPRFVPYLVVLGLLLIVAIGILLLIGSERARPLPPPFGPAGAGLVAFDSAGDIYVASASGTSPRLLIGGPDIQSSPTWSLDGTRIAYWSDPPGPDLSLWTVNADGTDPRKVSGDLSLLPDKVRTAVSWSPDSRRLAFSAVDEIGGPYRLFVAAADGSGARPIGDQSLARTHPAWSPDGKMMVFRGHDAKSAYLLGIADPALYVINADGSGQRRITWTRGDGEVFGLPQWSLDGRQVLYFTGRWGSKEEDQPAVGTTDGFDIAIAAADGSGEQILSGEPGNEWWPTWSPDGTRIAFRLLQPPAGDPVLVMDADGRNRRELVGAPRLKGFATCWSPDGRSLMAHNAAESGYVIFPIDGSAPPQEIVSDGLIAIGACGWQRLPLP